MAIGRRGWKERFRQIEVDEVMGREDGAQRGTMVMCWSHAIMEPGIVKALIAPPFAIVAILMRAAAALPAAMPLGVKPAARATPRTASVRAIPQPRNAMLKLFVA